MKRAVWIAVLLAVFSVAGLAMCPQSVKCAIDDFPMIWTGEFQHLNGREFHLYAHGAGSARHEIWIRCN